LHVSIEGGFVKSLERAVGRGCQTVQIFSSSPRGWYERDIKKEEATVFREKRQRLKIDPVIVHTKYLINTASQNTSLWNKSVESLRLCLKNAGLLGADFVVTHIGHAEDGYREQGIQRVASAITALFENEGFEVKLLLENSAGAGNSIGHNFKELGGTGTKISVKAI
jgi:deoxyribonuclease-4